MAQLVKVTMGREKGKKVRKRKRLGKREVCVWRAKDEEKDKKEEPCDFVHTPEHK